MCTTNWRSKAALLVGAAMLSIGALAQQPRFKLEPAAGSWSGKDVTVQLTKNARHPDFSNIAITRVEFFYKTSLAGSLMTGAYQDTGSGNGVDVSGVDGWSSVLFSRQVVPVGYDPALNIDTSFYLEVVVDYTLSGVAQTPDTIEDHQLKIDNMPPREATLKQIWKCSTRGPECPIPYDNNNFYGFTDDEFVGWVEPGTNLATETYWGQAGVPKPVATAGEPPYFHEYGDATDPQYPPTRMYVCSPIIPIDWVVSPEAPNTAGDGGGSGVSGYFIHWDQTSPDLWNDIGPGYDGTKANTATYGAKSQAELTSGDGQYWIHVRTFDSNGPSDSNKNFGPMVHYGPLYVFTAGPYIECPDGIGTRNGCPDVAPTFDLTQEAADDPSTPEDDTLSSVEQFQQLGGNAGFPEVEGEIPDLDFEVFVLSVDGPFSGTGCPDDPQEWRVRFRAQDECGNGSECTWTVFVSDSEPPTVPASLPGASYQCEALVPAPVTTIAGFESAFGPVSDNCTADADMIITSSDSALDGGPCGGTITRTYTIEDACGNEAVVAQTITINDTTGPAIDTQPTGVSREGCPDTLGALIGPWLDTNGGADASDNCGGVVTWTNNYDPANIVVPTSCVDNVVAYVDVTFTAEDECGNSTATSSARFSVTDNTAPTITAQPSGMLAEGCTGDLETLIAGWLANNGLASASDNCSDVTWSSDYTTGNIVTPATCDGKIVQYVDVIFTAMDTCGNTAVTTSARFGVTDTTKPTITCPDAVTIQCDDPIEPTVGITGVATATDLCDSEPTVTWQDSAPVAGACEDAYSFTRTWTAVDDCGNIATCEQVITVEDTTDPELTCPDDITVQCTDSTHPNNTGWADATDTCDDDVTLTYNDVEVAGACDQAKTITRTWTATDNCGNSVSCDQVITVVDTVVPDITCPADVTIECSESDAPANTGSPLVSDNCDPAPMVTYQDARITGECPELYVIERTWTATDDCGNVNTCLQIIRVVDTTKPVIICPGDVTVECDESTEPLNTGSATATDACDADPVITHVDSTGTGDAGTSVIERTWAAEDSCGNISTCVQIITINDVTPPTIICPDDITIECDDSADPGDTGTATATDNCTQVPAITSEDNVVPGACENAYVIERTWTATDNAGLTASCTQIITVQDTEAPTIICPDDITIECTVEPLPANTGEPTVSDTCDTDVSVTYSDDVAAGASGARVITRTWTATDNCGNSSSCTQIITVEDSIPPTIVCPDNVTVECDESTAPADLGMAQATDNCDSDIEITYSDAEDVGSCPQEKVITRTWTATDDAGNSASCQQIITVVDTKPPTVTCPADATVPCDGDLSPVTTGMATATDTCDGDVSVDYSDGPQIAGSCPQEYTIERTWTAVDDCGNVATCVQVITVVDDEAPELFAPADTQVECGEFTTPEYTGMATAEDNCDTEVTPAYSDVAVDGVCPVISRITRTWTAVDACGNSVSHEQIIEVVDTTAPALSCPADIEVECTSGTMPGVTGRATATDGCDDVVTVNYSDETIPGDCPQAYVIERTWTAVDDCGNEAECTQIITVTDSTVPEITQQPSDESAEGCPSDLDTLIAGWLANNGGATATDTCGAVSWTNDYAVQEPVVPTSCDGGVIAYVLVTFTAWDECDNSMDTETVQFSVLDTTAPTVTVDTVALEACYPNEDAAMAAIADATTVTDEGCSTDLDPMSPIVNLTQVVGTSCQYTFTVMAVDECGNVGQYSSTADGVQIRIDGDGPEATQGSLAGGCYLTEDAAVQAALDALTNRVDACGGAVTVAGTAVVPYPDDALCMFEIQVTLADECGNTSQFDFGPVQIDDTPPVCAACPLTVQLGPDSTYTLTPADIEAIACDVSDDCSEDVTVTVSPMTFGCADAGKDVTVTVTAEDACGNVSTCETTVTVVDFVTVSIGTGYTIMYPDGGTGTPFELAGPGNWVTVPISACHCQDLTQLVFDIRFDPAMLEYVVGSETWVTPKMNVSGPFANPSWVNIELGVSEEDGVGRLIVHIDSPTSEPAVLGGCGEFMTLMFRVSDEVTEFTELALDGDVIYATAMNGLEIGKVAEDGAIYADLCNWLLDVDRNGRVDPHTDGVILYRALKYGHLTDSAGDPIVPILPPDYAAAAGAYLPSDTDIVDYVDAVTDMSTFGQYFDSDDKADGPADGIGGSAVSASRNGVYVYRNLAGFPTYIYPVYAPPAAYSPFVNPETPLMATRGNTNVTVPSGHKDNLTLEDEINAEIDLLKILWCDFLFRDPVKVVSLGIALPLSPTPPIPLDWWVSPDKVVPLPQPPPAATK